MPLIYSVFVPHPPILVPEIGRGEEKACAATLEAYCEISRRLVSQQIELVLLISPHAHLLQNGVTIVKDELIQGNFRQFGAAELSVAYPNHVELAASLLEAFPEAYGHTAGLDHGALVPLYFLQTAGWQGKLVLMSMPMQDPEQHGRILASILRRFPERIALIASGDLSHRLKKDGPYGLHPAGPLFDQAIVDALKSDVTKIEQIAPELADEAGDCGWRSLRMALAAQEGMPEVLSYEGPFGVGYLVAELYRSSALAHWARQCLAEHLAGGNVDSLELPSAREFQVKQACFVTLKMSGELRGCIGTTEPWHENLALEIRQNAISAATRDPRFPPVRKNELAKLMISVDVLGEMQKIESIVELDPWRFGVVVRGRGKTGLLLPHLQGIDTVAEQVSIAKQKAGLSVHEPVEMWRFEVKRYFE